ncbi:MAG: hypothetical protein V1789_07465 [PVC group bacterium]
MIRKIPVKMEYLVALLALAAGLYSQSSAIVNAYVINDDAMQHIYWMRQFQSPGLFKDDLLTENARHWLPWGLIFFYYAGSFLIDPVMISKLAPLFLFPLSSAFAYGLVKRITGSRYISFLAAVIFIFTATFFQSMIGGHPRAFGFPLLIMFLYYLVTKRYPAAAVVMIAQSLFYPVVFLLSSLTCLCTFIQRKDKKIIIDRSRTRALFFGGAILAGCSLLIGEYAVSDNPRLGSLITREAAAGRPENYEKGRFRIMPISPLFEQVKYNLKESIFGYRMIEYLKERAVMSGVVRKYEEIVEPRRPGLSVTDEIALVIFIFLLAAGIGKKIRFPPEIYYLLFSGIVLYWLSSLVLFKLYRPERYVEYSFRIAGLIFFSVISGRLIEGIRQPKVKTFFRAVPIVLACLFFRANRGLALTDLSSNRELYEYLRGLPEEAMIAAHPCLADGVPLFSRKKVFINFELSNPWYGGYWETIRKRTLAFFDAYYSENPAAVYQFCRQNEIDYVMVDEKHFQKDYLDDGKVYFEPFQGYISRLVKERKNFILPRMEEKDLLFHKNGITVIHRDAFGDRHDFNRRSEKGQLDS